MGLLVLDIEKYDVVIVTRSYSSILSSILSSMDIII